MNKRVILREMNYNPGVKPDLPSRQEIQVDMSNFNKIVSLANVEKE